MGLVLVKFFVEMAFAFSSFINQPTLVNACFAHGGLSEQIPEARFTNSRASAKVVGKWWPLYLLSFNLWGWVPRCWCRYFCVNTERFRRLVRIAPNAQKTIPRSCLLSGPDHSHPFYSAFILHLLIRIRLSQWSNVLLLCIPARIKGMILDTRF